ncbi:MAG: SDR family oxidoreductase [Betaproteobacteria bacterium]|nr:SDR family oxidoreductase [Betaproteobacteria bacterium]
MNVEGRVAVITGASSGIGAGLAKHFVAQGMQVALCSRRSPVLSEGDNVLARSVDVSDEAAVFRFADETAKRFGRIDLWVNNAGVVEPIGMLHDLDMREFERNHHINFMGVVHGTRAFIRHVRGLPKREGESVLVNVSSAAARQARAGMSAYSSAKAAIDRLTEAVAEEERDAGLVALAFSPGMVDSGTQAVVRSMPVERMPASDNNRRAAALGRFNSTEHVAQHLLKIAFDPAARPQGYLYVVPNQY